MRLDGFIRRLSGQSAPTQATTTPTAEDFISRLSDKVSAGDIAVKAWLIDMDAAFPGDDITATRAAQELLRLDRADLAESWLNDWLTQHRGLWSERERAQLVVRRDLSAAVGLYEQICESYPNEAIIFADRIELMMHAGRLTEAASVADAALTRFPTDTWLWDKSAVLAERRGDPQTAYSRWRTLYRFDPTHSRALVGMARLLSRLRKVHALERLMETTDLDLGVTPVDDKTYRIPSDLTVTPTRLRRVLVIGSCLAAGLPDVFRDEAGVSADFILINNAAELPEAPPCPLEDYDFQFIQLPLRAVLPDGAHFSLAYDRPEDYQALFEACCDRLSRLLANTLAWNRGTGLPAFVSNFILPQQNAMGRLMPRYDLRNFVFFTEELNRHLASELASYNSAYLVDTDQIVAGIGRRFLQDDMVWVTGHASILSNADHAGDQARLEVVSPVQDYYPGQSDIFCTQLWRELEAGFRSLQQVDAVKMVLVDLDDTLWRGILAEAGSAEIEGWPVGFAEALMFLKRRGILLGIVSKNSEDRIRELWPFDRLMPLDTFAIHRINWKPKAENIADILAEVNLLPKNVVFIDDNPVERAAVTAAFPDLRVLGANPYLLRRILLWSAETQSPVVTDESARRTEMIQAQGQRERSRKAMSREDFLASLQVRVSLKPVSSSADPAFPRTFELLNKTNQFNTTGVRWSTTDAETFFARGGVFYALHVSDIYTRYGLVGVMSVEDDTITQFVMSCRVVGLDVELAAVAECLRTMGPVGEVQALALKTEANRLSQDIWQRTGFESRGDRFVLPQSRRPALPAHISVEA